MPPEPLPCQKHHLDMGFPGSSPNQPPGTSPAHPGLAGEAQLMHRMILSRSSRHHRTETCNTPHLRPSRFKKSFQSVQRLHSPLTPRPRAEFLHRTPVGIKTIPRTNIPSLSPRDKGHRRIMRSSQSHRYQSLLPNPTDAKSASRLLLSRLLNISILPNLPHHRLSHIP